MKLEILKNIFLEEYITFGMVTQMEFLTCDNIKVIIKYIYIYRYSEFILSSCY